MKTQVSGFAAFCTVLLFISNVSLAQTAGSLSLGEEGGSALNLSMNVRAEVSGLVARVWISQTFLYQGTEPVEGIYQFPLPPEAAVDSLTVTLDDRRIVGEIREREQARRDYDQARTEGRRAALVEQEKANLFTTSIANVEPGIPVNVEIAYQQTLAYDGGEFELRVPFAVTPRYTPEGEAGPAVADPIEDDCNCGHAPTRAVIDVRLNEAWAVADLSSPSHKLKVRDEGDAFGIGIAPEAPLDGDFVLRWTPLVKGQVGTSVFTETFEGEDYALLLFVPGLQPRPAMPREVIFVIDTSGSMKGESIDQARTALVEALTGLRSADRFNVIQFNSTTESLFPESVAAGIWARGQAENYIRHLHADGGTEMGPALVAALAATASPGYLRQVIFITDGAVGNETELFELITRVLGEARLFTVGIGAAPNRLFMERAARAGRGSATYIGDTADVSARMNAMFERLSLPVLTDIRLDAGGRDVIVPDVYAGQPTMITMKLPVSTGVLNVTGTVDGSIWAQQLAIGEKRSHAGVARLWARQRIGELMQAPISGADPDWVRTQVVDLGLRFGLTSRYTSLVAIEKTPRLAQGGNRQARIPTPVPGMAFPRTAAGFDYHLTWLLVMICALIALRFGRLA